MPNLSASYVILRCCTLASIEANPQISQTVDVVNVIDGTGNWRITIMQYASNKCHIVQEGRSCGSVVRFICFVESKELPASDQVHHDDLKEALQWISSNVFLSMPSFRFTVSSYSLYILFHAKIIMDSTSVGVKYSTCTWYLYLSTYLSVLDVLEYLVHINVKVLVLVLVLDQKVLGT